MIAKLPHIVPRHEGQPEWCHLNLEFNTKEGGCVVCPMTRRQALNLAGQLVQMATKGGGK